MSQLEPTEIQITYWREIPSMVAARSGGEVAKVQLPQRFQEAIDEAAMRLGESGSEAYLAGWIRSDWQVVSDNPTAASQQASEQLDTQWPQERLDSYLDSLA